MQRVFVSYSRRNKNFAERIARDLSDAGLDVWVDWRQIHAGELWQNEIFRGIEMSDMLVVCLSPDAVISDWVQREVNAAREQDKFIIPVMAIDAMTELQATDNMRWLLNVHFINFEGRYEEAFPELLSALPGKRRVSPYDEVNPAEIPNPFKGLEAFQQTDSHFFFGRAKLIERSLKRLAQKDRTRFLAVVGASGSGKSSLVRAGVIPQIRQGALRDSDQWPLSIFTPGAMPVDALAQRLAPLIADHDATQVGNILMRSETALHTLSESILDDDNSRLLLVVDQFEEVFTRAPDKERAIFFDLLHHAVSVKGGRTQVIITMRADFFDRLSRYPKLAELFEQENMLIVTEMTSAELLRSIEGPAKSVGLVYEEGLAQRILEDVRRQPGSLPLLQYALKELYQKREGRYLTNAAYDAIGGVESALAQHAEDIYRELAPAEQAIMRRVLLRLVEISEEGEATRRRINREDLHFRDVDDAEIQEVIDIMTAPDSRLLITSREIKASDDDTTPPIVWVEVSHEALIRQWDRFTGWVAENIEGLRYGSELLQSATDWHQSGRDKAYLLTGNRLVRAEGWIQHADPTTLQREFIAASIEEDRRQRAIKEAQAQRELELQQRAASRLRNFVIVLVISLVVAIGLSIFALNRQNAAEDALDQVAVALATAERSGNEASSLALAASADRAINDNNGDLALILALGATNIDSPPPQSLRTLAEVAYAPGTRRVFNQHDNTVNDVVYANNGERALSVGGSTVIVWNPRSGEVLTTLNEDGAIHAQLINTMDVSRDWRILATGGNDGMVALWDIDPASPTFRQSLGQFMIHTDRVLDLAWMPDALQVASGSADGTVVMWDADPTSPNFGQTVQQYNPQETTINTVAFNRNGSRLASGGENGAISIWNTNNGVLTCQLRTNSPINSIAFNPRQASLVTGSDDGVVRFWSLTQCDFDRQITEHGTNPVNTLAFNANGSLLLSGGDDNIVVVYNVEDEEVTNRFGGHTGSIRNLAINDSGSRALSASADTSVRVLDIIGAEDDQTFTGHTVLLGDGEAIGVYNGAETRVLSGAQDSTVRLWDVVSGLAIDIFQGHDDAVLGVAMSSDESTALSASADDTLILWDMAEGVPLATLSGHAADVTTVMYLPDERQAISGSADSTLILWDIDPASATFGQAIRTFSGHGKAVNDLALSPDATQVVSASSDETLILWDIATGDVIRRYTDQKTGILGVDFSPDGTQLVSSPINGTVVLWDVATGEVIRRYSGHTGAVFDVEFGPAGAYIVSGGQDDTVRVWDVESGFEIRRYNAPSAVFSVDVSETGSEVLTGLEDGRLKTWRVLTELDDLVTWVYLNRFVDEPTCAERDFYRLAPCVDGQPPVETPFPVPTVTPTPDNRLILESGITAEVNVDTTLNVREGPGTDQTPILLPNGDPLRLQDGDVVTLLDGPVTDGDFLWWQIQTADGVIGWVVESLPDSGLKTLLPLE